MPSEAKWIVRLQNGERAAYEELLDRFGPKIRSLAGRYSDSKSDADDLTQEIFIEVFKSIPAFRGDAQFSTWLYRIALNRCLKFQEKTRRETGLHDSSVLENQLLEIPDQNHSTDPKHGIERGELRQQLNCAFENLSEPHREIVILHELQNMTYAQCAQILEIPIGTVKSRLFHAFRALRTQISPYISEGESL